MYNVHENQNEQKPNYKFIILSSLAVLIAAAIVIGLNVYLNIIQLDEAGGYSFVFLTNLKYMIMFAAMVFVVVFSVVTLNTVFIRRNLYRFMRDNSLPGRKLPFLSISLISAIFAVILTNNNFYKKIIPYLNSVSFGKETPIIGGDVGYFIFERPFLMSIYSFAMGFAFFIIIYTIAYYLMTMTAIYSTMELKLLRVRTFIRHIIINIALLFLIKAFSFNFDKEGIVYGTVVNTTGASYIDEHIWLNFYNIAPFLTIGIVLLTLYFTWRGKLKNAAISAALFPAVWILVSVAAFGMQTLIVKPNEAIKEFDYLKYSISKTREAYGLDKIKTIEVEGIKELTPDAVKKNIDTVSNIQIVDYDPTLRNNIQMQANTTFYTFNDGDVVSYDINNKKTPILISAREIDKSKIAEKSYINTMFKYTHGFGIVVNPLNRITAQGQVDFIMSGLVMNSTDKNLKVKEPRIYYGEITKDRVIVKANGINEIDGDGTAETRYEGKGGIKLSLLNRLLFAMKYADQNLLISNYVSSESRMLVNREVSARVKMVAPFLEVDKDPYMVLTDDGRLKWVVDAYTVSDNYPFSEYTLGINYIRNSVKAVVDAYDGDVTLYVIDEKDPIINMWRNAYAKLFSKETLPKDLASHAVYPEMLFMLQTQMMNRYHLDPVANEETVNYFYYNQDLWDIAKFPKYSGTTTDTKSKVDIEPYYNFIKLPKVTTKEELVLIRPFTPLNRDSMVAWMAVRNSFENYGEMVLYTFPKNTNIYGPYQVEANINSIDKVSKDITLWNQSGSSVFKGSLLVVPIEDSILYVEPIYIQAAGPSSIPQVREIVIGYQKGDEFVYGLGTNLDEAFNDLFDGLLKEPEKQATPVKETKPATSKDKVVEELKSKLEMIKKQLEEVNGLINDISGQ